jgi:hypothetical protein
VQTATRLGFREQARRPLLLVLLVGVLFLLITRAIARTEATPRAIGLPGGGEVFTTMRDLQGASMATITTLSRRLVRSVRHALHPARGPAPRRGRLPSDRSGARALGSRGGGDIDRRRRFAWGYGG